MGTVEKIIKVRTDKGLNQAKFAESIGVSRGIISRIESGERIPTLKLLKKISDAHAIDFFWLQNDEADSSSVLSKNNDFSDYEIIFSYIRNRKNGISIDLNNYLLLLRKEAYLKSKMLLPSLFSLTLEKKRGIILSSSDVITELIANKRLKLSGIPALYKYISGIDDSRLNKIFENFQIEFGELIWNERAAEFPGVIREIYEIFNDLICYNELINLLVKHNLMQISDYKLTTVEIDFILRQ